MYRGTTPQLVFNIDPSFDLRSIFRLYITMKSKIGDNTKEFDISQVTINADDHTIILPLTQLDTLYFKGSTFFDEGREVYVQLRIKDVNNAAYASNIMTITINDILKDGEI